MRSQHRTMGPLELAEDEAHFGGKAVQLGASLRAGLPVPGGVALDVACVEAVVSGDLTTLANLREVFALLGAPLAVRSSAVGEDSAGASFAGQHATVLNVCDASALIAAVVEIQRSAHADSALAYRRKLGLPPAPRMAVVVQTLVRADVAGVLFTRHPLSQADERLIEASWGLGEAVVAGLVTPDSYRVARGGKVLARSAGDKDLEIVRAPHGGTEQRAVDAARATRLCLSDFQLRALDQLATRCEAVFGGSQDLEWAFSGDQLYLLQRRAITRGA